MPEPLLQEPISTLEQTPPTNTPPAPPIEDPKDKQIKIFEDLTRSQNARITELEQAMAANKPVAPPEEKISPEQFFADPYSHVANVVEKKMRDTVAPLIEYVAQLKGSTKIDQFVNQFKSDSRFSSQWDDGLERYVREQAATVNPNQLNENTFGLVVLTGLGMKAAGLLPGSTNRQSVPANNPPANPSMPTNREIIPPYLAPSNMPASSDGNRGEKKLRPLTEHEERLRRERRQTHEEFLSWLDVPASQVAFSDVGKPKENK